MNMNDKPVPANIECQSEIDKDLVRTYYGDREAFDRVRAFIAATPAVGGEAWFLTREDMEKLHGQAHSGAVEQCSEVITPIKHVLPSKAF